MIRLAILICFMRAASAAVVFSTFGPGDAYDYADVDVSGPGKVTFSFTVPAGPSYVLDAMDLPMSARTPPVMTQLFLHEVDPGTGLPGTLLTGFAPINVLNMQPGDIFTTLPLVVGVPLVAGTTYWIVHQPPTGFEVGWQANSLGVVLPGAYTLSGSPPWVTGFDREVCVRIRGTVAGPMPSCTIAVPPGTQSGAIDASVDSMSPSSGTVDVALDFSTDGGASFAPATMDAASPSSNPLVGAPVGIASFLWDSRADMVGIATIAPGVVVRATVDDGVGASDCTVMLDIDNTMLCGGICGDCNLNGQGPDVLDALAAAQIAAGLVVPTMQQRACCDVDSSLAVVVIDALLIAQQAAGLAIVLACP